MAVSAGGKKMNDNSFENKSPTTSLQRTAAIVFLFITIVVSYHRTINDPFVWDDPILVTQNQFIQKLDNLKKLFTRDYFTQKIEISYRPVNTFTFFIDYAVWGNRTPGYHLENILLHFFNSLLLFALLARLLRKPWLALALSMIFAVHPVLTEALNAVTFREDPLCLLFMLLSFILYMSRGDGGRASFVLKTIGSLAMLFLALFTKETAAVFPAVILAAEYFLTSKPSHRKALANTALYSVPVLFYLYMRFGPMRSPSEFVIFHGGPLNTIILTIHAWARYIMFSIWPARLCVGHEFPVAPSLTGASTLAAFFVLIAAFALVLIAHIRTKRAGFGAAWFALMLLPVSNIIPIGVIMAERYLYTALPGFLILAGFVLQDLFLSDDNKYPSLSRIVLTALLVASIALGAFATINRNKVWGNEITFWKTATECAPSSSWVYVNLGVACINAGKNEEAKESLVRAVRLASAGAESDVRYGTLYRALTNLGIVYAKEDQLNKAIELLKASAILNPHSPFSFWNLGVVYFRYGDIKSAEHSFLRGLEIEPSNASAHLYLLTIYLVEGRLKDALAECDRILAMSPNDNAIKVKREEIIRELDREKAGNAGKQ
jgi:protein O-mannosyl-transferase